MEAFKGRSSSLPSARPNDTRASSLNPDIFFRAARPLLSPPYTRKRPAFRDGVIADAVGAAVDSGSLYFSSAGNNGPGYRFASAR